MTKKFDKKLFVIRKYVWAKTAADAIINEQNFPVDDVWVDDEWKKNHQDPKDAIGFNLEYIDG